jgi:hypothetical protein
LCLNIICNRSFFLFWNDVSFVPIRVLHKDEKILGRKHIYLPHAQTAIYESKVKLFLKQRISHQLGRDAVVRFVCENSGIDVTINFLWKIFHKPIVLVVLTTANFGGFSNFCRYYTRSQTGKSTGYRPTLKHLSKPFYIICLINFMKKIHLHKSYIKYLRRYMFQLRQNKLKWRNVI